ncbi:MAG: hypothetical protein JW967_11285 [Dehalococcoidales bacterium]|nr:hypothetical protein [Dehalococcoidales bacterium]
MECNRCGNKLNEDERYTYQDKIICEKCYMDVGLRKEGCSPNVTDTTGSSNSDKKDIAE